MLGRSGTSIRTIYTSWSAKSSVDPVTGAGHSLRRNTRNPTVPEDPRFVVFMPGEWRVKGGGTGSAMEAGGRKIGTPLIDCAPSVRHRNWRQVGVCVARVKSRCEPQQ